MAVEAWVKQWLHMTVSAVLCLVVVAPFFEPVLRLALRGFTAWLDKLKSDARGRSAKLLDPGCEYACLLLEERNAGRGRGLEADAESLCELLLAGSERIDREVGRLKRDGLPLTETLQELWGAVTYARRFHLEEYVQPGDPDTHNKRWLRVLPGSEALTRITIQQLLPALSSILAEAVGRQGFRRRPSVCVSNKRPELLRPSQGVGYHSFLLLRERKQRPVGPSTKGLLDFGIQVLAEHAAGEQGLQGQQGQQGRRDSQIVERLAAYELQEVPSPLLAGYLQEPLRDRHVLVHARLDRSMDHEETMELPELLRRPFEVACVLHGLLPLLDPDWSLRVVTRGAGPAVPYPQVPLAASPRDASSLQPRPATLGQPAYARESLLD